MKKILVPLILLPFLFVLIRLLTNNYSYFYTIQEYIWVEILINILPMLLFVAFDVYKNAKFSIIDTLIRSSFYVYLAYLLLFTIGYIPFAFIFTSNEFSIDNINALRVNIIPLKSYLVDSFIPLALYGNLILLFPLGVYIALLYNEKINKFITVLSVLIISSLLIETTQLIGTLLNQISGLYMYSRAFDVDDILLNVSGGIVGFLITRLLYSKIFKRVLNRDLIA